MIRHYCDVCGKDVTDAPFDYSIDNRIDVVVQGVVVRVYFEIKVPSVDSSGHICKGCAQESVQKIGGKALWKKLP